MSNEKTPVSISNVIALDKKRRAQYPTTLEIAGQTVNLKNAAGAIIATGTTQDTTYEVASTTKEGLLSSEDKTKLDGLENYTLPQATETVLGGVMVTSATDSTSTTAVLTAAAGKAIMEAARAAGKSLDLAGTTLTLKDADGNPISTITIPEYILPAATTSTLGGVKAGTGVNIAADGTISVEIPSDGLSFKGTVATEDELPKENQKQGDFYMVGTAAPYKEFFWDGKEWEMFGIFSDSFDTANIVLKTEYLDDDAFLALVTD